VQAPGGPDIVVAELGTGDAFWGHSPTRFEANMRRFLTAVTPHVECVIWVDQNDQDNRAYPEINQRYRAFNDVVHRVVRDYPDATYLHYSAWSRMAGVPSEWFLADWLHLTNAGEQDLARLVASAVRGCDPDLTSGPFWDVQDAFWAADAINWAAGEGLIGGYDNGSYRATVGHFRPKVTRGQAAQMLWRLAGSPNDPRPHGWTDSAPWLRSALRWGRGAHVLTGFSDDTFRPNAPVTRGQLVGWLWRTAGRPSAPAQVEWPDATAALFRPLNWAAANDIVDGVGGRFDRLGSVDRAQVAVWLQRTSDFLHPDPAPPDPTPAPATTLPPPTTAPTTTSPATTVP
jgi:hypothetical protein